MFDPSNACQLRCPGCVHSETATERYGFDWPSGMAKLDEFEALLRWMGPYAFNVVYFNYGEPLLNKNIADFVLASNGYGLSSVFSTNLSLRFDAERFVAAAPDYVILSIDGTTQDVYEFYRRRGDIELVFENLRRLVDAKRRLGQNRPLLVWRFFTFEHNLHQVDDAIRMAREFGVNEIHISTPNDISSDDQRVRVAVSERRGVHQCLPWEPKAPELIHRHIRRHAEVDALFKRKWTDELKDATEFGESRRSSSTCSWLYYSMTVDAARRIMPCCLSPSRTMNLVFGSTQGGAVDPFNLEAFAASRLAFADRERFLMAPRANGKTEPFCASCKILPGFTHTPENAVGDMKSLDYLHAVPPSADPVLRKLHHWA
jgi:MoaA/NifB/PqqE/SkfB family radical SAM enzyme